MAYIMTIDSGTSNTRVFLLNDENVLKQKSIRNIGVRCTAIDGDNERLKSAIQSCIKEVMEKENISWNDVRAVVASGMLTSSLGLKEVPHLVVPVCLEMEAKALCPVLMDELCPKPIYFVPGIKNYEKIPEKNPELMDMMRGEETEAFALIDRCFTGEAMILALPGSHFKYVSVNKKKEITGCLTTMAGEILNSLTNDTILADTVKHNFVQKDMYEKRALLHGYQMEKKLGFTQACFLARTESTFLNKTDQESASYLLGVILGSDIQALRQSPTMLFGQTKKLVVSGNEITARALCDILLEEIDGIKIMVDDSKGCPLSAQGAKMIFEHK